MVNDRRFYVPARIRALPASVKDALLALLVYAEGTLEIQLTHAADKLLAQAILLVFAVAVVARRRFPVAAVLFATGGLAIMGRLSIELTDGLGGVWLVTLFLVYSMASRTEGPRLWAACVALTLGAWGAALLDNYPDKIGDLLFIPCLFVAAPVAAGQLIRNRTALNRTLREKATRAEAERLRIAESAVADERTRIAGELHDVVAHALGAMTVQAAAARRLSEKDPDRARDAFLAVEDTGREALTELRRLLGVLRKEDEEIALAPQPRLAYLRDLVRRARAAGLPTTLVVDGEAPETMPAGVDLTGYRLVQEALNEALDFGGAGQAEVRVVYRGGTVEIEVSDDGRNEDPRALLGMRERVQIYGGELEATATPLGHRMRARLPLEATT